MNFLDIALAGLLLFGGLVGYRKGLINSLIGIAGIFAAFIVALFNYKTLAPVLYNQVGVGKFVESLVSHNISKSSAAAQNLLGNGFEQFTGLSSLIPREQRGGFNTMFASLMKSTAHNPVHTAGDAVAQYFSLVMASMLAFFLIFIATYLLLGIMGHILTKGLKKSGFGGVNHFGGFVLGFMGASLIASTALAFLAPLVTVLSKNTLSRLVEHSLLTPYIFRVFSGLAHTIGGA